jgi:hypothetical protein
MQHWIQRRRSDGGEEQAAVAAIDFTSIGRNKKALMKPKTVRSGGAGSYADSGCEACAGSTRRAMIANRVEHSRLHCLHRSRLEKSRHDRRR